MYASEPQTNATKRSYEISSCARLPFFLRAAGQNHGGKHLAVPPRHAHVDGERCVGRWRVRSRRPVHGGGLVNVERIHARDLHRCIYGLHDVILRVRHVSAREPCQSTCFPFTKKSPLAHMRCLQKRLHAHPQLQHRRCLLEQSCGDGTLRRLDPDPEIHLGHWLRLRRVAGQSHPQPYDPLPHGENEGDTTNGGALPTRGGGAA